METYVRPTIPELDPAIAQQIELLPKSELHLHLEGTMAVETFQKLARDNEHPLFMNMPEAAVRQMYEYKKGEAGFNQFLDLFGFCSEVLQHKEDIVYIVEQLGAYARSQNMLYAEITYTPTTIRHNPFGRNPNGGGLSYEDQLDALKTGMQNVAAMPDGPALRFILDHSRGYTEQDCIDTANMCVDGYEQGVVVGMGLGGGEVDHPVSEWAPTIQRILRSRVPFVPHVAEIGDGEAAVLDALNSYQGNMPRFGHGIQAAYSDEALQWIADRGIVLEICPSSNLATGVVPSLATLQYLVRRLQQCNVAYTIGTDDSAMLPGYLEPHLDNTLNKEWKMMVQLGLETPTSLARMCLLSIQASLLPPAQKQTLMQSAAAKLHTQGYDVPALLASLPHANLSRLPQRLAIR